MIQILDSGLYEPRTTTLHETPKPEAVWAHEEDRMNAFGLVVMDGDPVICGHGGSMWLCRGCARNIAIETGHREQKGEAIWAQCIGTEPFRAEPVMKTWHERAIAFLSDLFYS